MNIFLCITASVCLFVLIVFLVVNHQRQKINVREEFDDILAQIKAIRSRRDFLEAEADISWFKLYADTAEHAQWVEDLLKMLEPLRHRVYDDEDQFENGVLQRGFYRPVTEAFLWQPGQRA